MLQNLCVENFRGFKQFELNPLGRINLLVGANNSGKTSLLEAIYLLLKPDPISSLYDVCMGRNEYSITEENSKKGYQQPVIRQLQITHLIHNHKLLPNIRLKISTSANRGPEQYLSMQINLDQDPQGDLDLYDFDLSSPLLTLEIESLGSLAEPLKIRVSPQGLVRFEDLRRMAGQVPRHQELDPQLHLNPVQFVRTLGLSIEETLELFNDISLTPQEDWVIAALQIIDRQLQRIAPEGSTRRYSKDSFIRGGFKVKIEGQDQPVPIGTMGEGMWRMLGLVLAIVNAKDGVLLIDEIDSGLHFTAMTPMWRMIAQTAQDFNVQVFATTHSQDCWRSLAKVVQDETMDLHSVFVHRIHPDRTASIVYDWEELVIAANDDLEVR